MTDARKIREALLELPMETSNFGKQPSLAELYIPPAHLKALRLEAHVVIGGRGVGKSFWTTALTSPSLRSAIGAALPELDGVDVRIGFMGADSIDEYPNADSLGLMLEKGVDPYDIWRAVILRWVAQRAAHQIPFENWDATVAWLKAQPETAARLMQAPRSWKGLILFDALDRSSADWQQMDGIVRGLLRAVLWLKTHQGLHAKVFLREDQAERTVFNFPDSSKLLANKAELVWARHDLHGFLWQRLINVQEPHGACLRDVCKTVLSQQLRANSGVYLIPDDLKRETDAQRRAFEVLAGPWMGRDRRRGVPYTWAVGHLADGRGQTSPRSFLAAIRQAAEDSQERYPDHEFALHYESIKRGIQKASEIRVAEVAEDYPWVPQVLDALEGLIVPCEYEVIEQRWDERFAQGPKSIQTDKLPAQNVDRGWSGVRDDLIRLGLIEQKKDERIDMPDLYRVGFRLGRRGGVKPKP